MIGQEEQQQCMLGPICTECARTARKRTIGALVFLRIIENPEENLKKKKDLCFARKWRWESQ